MEATRTVVAQLHLNGCTHILPEGRLFLSGGSEAGSWAPPEAPEASVNVRRWGDKNMLVSDVANIPPLFRGCDYIYV